MLRVGFRRSSSGSGGCSSKESGRRQWAEQVVGRKGEIEHSGMTTAYPASSTSPPNSVNVLPIPFSRLGGERNFQPKELTVVVASKSSAAADGGGNDQ